MSSKIQVLHITQSSVAGVATYIEYIFKYLDKSKYELYLICLPNSPLSKVIKKLGYKHFPIAFPRNISPIQDLLACIGIYRVIKNTRCQIIHLHSSKAGFIGRFVAMLSGFKQIIYTPNAFYYLSQSGMKRHLFIRLEKLAKPFSKYLIATSYSEYKRAVDEISFNKNKVVKIDNSIDVRPLKIKANDSMVNSIMFVGRFCYQKNPEMFIRMVKILNNVKPQQKYVMIGYISNDIESENAKNIIKKYNLINTITIIEWQDRKRTLDMIQHCSVMVMPSRYESFGYVAAEAMALNKPVVATNVDGLKNVIKHKNTGYLVGLNDDESMAYYVLKLINNPDLGFKLGSAGRKRVIEKFNIEKNIKLLETVYNKCYI